MGLFDFFNKNKNKSAYQKDSYYKNKVFAGTSFEKNVITFDKRKKISYPSKNGLYVAEILLLEYVSYGKYPNPKNGYPGFWWFEYGIRDIENALLSLEKKGYIEYAGEKYKLTQLGIDELNTNKYIPFMHKERDKTREGSSFGPEYNVWSINKILKGDTTNWELVVNKERNKLIAFLERNNK